MFTKTKFAAAFAALTLGVTAFASTSEARSPYYYWNWGWGASVGYAPIVYTPMGYGYVVQTRHGPRVCHKLAEYTDWGFYVGDNLVCARH